MKLTPKLTSLGVSLVWGKMTYVFHKTKNDGTMSKVNQYIEGTIVSIHKI